jgi:hypothetical protein
MAHITVNTKKYAVKFGYGAFKALGEAWNCDGIQAIVKEFQQIFPEVETGEDTEVDIPFKNFDKIGDLALAGMSPFTDELPKRDDVVDALIFQGGGQLQVLMDAFQESFPKSGNVEPRKKARQKKKK